MFVDLPPDPSFLHPLHAILPWPAQVSLQNFIDVFSDQPFGRWLLHCEGTAGLSVVAGAQLLPVALEGGRALHVKGQQPGHVGQAVQVGRSDGCISVTAEMIRPGCVQANQKDEGRLGFPAGVPAPPEKKEQEGE